MNKNRIMGTFLKSISNKKTTKIDNIQPVKKEVSNVKKEEINNEKKKVSNVKKEKISEPTKQSYSDIVSTKEDNIIDKDFTSHAKKETIFVDNSVKIDFKHFRELFKQCSIYRIKMKYNLLNRKIIIIDKICEQDSEKGLELKTYYNYIQMFELRNTLEKYYNFYYILKKIHTLLIEYIEYSSNHMDLNKNILNTDKQFNLDTISLVSEIEIIMNNCSTDFRSLYGDTIMNLTNLLDILRDNIYQFDKNSNINFTNAINLIDVCCCNINITMNLIAETHDQHIECRYHIEIKDDVNNPLKITKIYNFLCFKCSDEILDLTSKKYSDINIESINLKSFFDEEYNMDNGNHFITIYCYYSEINYCSIHFSFDLLDSLPFESASINIYNSPSKYLIYTSPLHNYKLEKPRFDQSVPINCDPSTYWLDSYIRKKAYRITKQEYNNLPKYIRDKYSYEVSHKNKFVLKFIFEEIKRKDSNNMINDKMFKSFKKLALQTSKKNFN